jgi:hypothetical protein
LTRLLLLLLLLLQHGNRLTRPKTANAQKEQSLAALRP